VVRDPLTGLPIIPGSSLKGKMRALLQRSLSGSFFAKGAADKNESLHDMDEPQVKRLFGGDKGKTPSRLQFVDAFLGNRDKLESTGFTEIKFENTINRLCGTANPRQIERVVRGSVFDFRLVYDILEKSELDEDFRNLAKAMALLQMDYLGGHGTRGYGRVRFSDFEVEAVDDSVSPEKANELCEILKEVCKDELLPVSSEI
jgi:CRISPR-associated protein Csm3